MGYCTTDPFSDTCKYISGYSNGDCRNASQNTGSSWGTAVTYYGYLFGAASKCVIGNVIKTGYVARTSSTPGCYQYRCDSGNVIFKVGTGEVTCTTKG